MLRIVKNVYWIGPRRILSFGLLALGATLLVAPGALAENATGPAEPDTAVSETTSHFQLPHTLQEGRDPFFPTSTRVIAMTRPVPQPTPGPAKFELKGISGTPERPLAIINNRTMAEGEESSVTTDQGRVQVKCIAIDVQATKVRIMAQGRTQDLVLRKGI